MENAPKYGRVAEIYDLLADIYSMGQTRVSKHRQTRRMKPNDRVLVAGAGGGSEVVSAADQGAKVTVVELAPAMVELIRNRLERAGLLDRAQLIAGDIMDHRVADDERYDIVTANFLLPAFHKERWPRVLQHLTSLIKPGGYLLIADYAPIRGSYLMRALQASYYVVGNLGAKLTAGNVMHRPMEPPSNWYSERLEDAGFVMGEMEYFRLAYFGPRWLAGWSARKPLA